MYLSELDKFCSERFPKTLSNAFSLFKRLPRRWNRQHVGLYLRNHPQNWLANNQWEKLSAVKRTWGHDEDRGEAYSGWV